MTYGIVADEKELRRFIEWLPSLTDNEKFYCSLFARKKYCPHLIKSNDKTQLKRFTSDKDRLLQKIYQLEIAIDRYYLKGENSAPQESLVTYINPNPRCMRNAAFALGGKLLKMIKDDNKGYNIHAEALSCIQQSKSRSFVVDFDFDFKDDSIISKCVDVVGKDALTVIETRGGYHVLVKPHTVYNDRSWYQIIKNLGCDQSGDQMVPIVGCFQGGFVPKFVDL